jgi:hypothetical protein
MQYKVKYNCQCQYTGISVVVRCVRPISVPSIYTGISVVVRCVRPISVPSIYTGISVVVRCVRPISVQESPSSSDVFGLSPSRNLRRRPMCLVTPLARSGYSQMLCEYLPHSHLSNQVLSNQLLDHCYITAVFLSVIR